MGVVRLNVDGIQKLTTELSLDDLIWLYRDYERKTGKIPITTNLLSKNNLPQQRRVNEILVKNNLTYKEFLQMLGKISHTRANIADYDKYVQKYKELSNKRGIYINSGKLINNSLGLPSASWFVKYCPDKNVNSFDEFVKWCGFRGKKVEKHYITQKLFELQNKKGKYLIEDDICFESVGFSMIAINRIWGSFSKCEEDLGLEKTISSKPKLFTYYKKELDSIIANYSKDTDKDYIMWRDIENSKYNPNRTGRKAIIKSFTENGVNVFLYIESMGYKMHPSKTGHIHIFDDGEKAMSNMEYMFSSFLKSNSFVYKKDYNRDVMYRKFTKFDSGKTNCDYVFSHNGKQYYLEIAGVVDNSNNDWDITPGKDKFIDNYKKKLKRKKEMLESERLNYLFLFSNDFNDDSYKEKFLRFLSRK